MNPRISVIVPVYRVKPYLAACLSSLSEQTLSDIEVICVDDASSDGSIEIAEQVAASDPRFRVVRHASNQGLSAARNTGLGEARAPWTLFIDSDDVVSKFICEHTLQAAEGLEADVVFFDYKTFDDGGPLPPEPAPARAILADREMLLERRAFAWTKLTKTSLLKGKKILFPMGLCFEDVPVHWRLVLESDKPAWLNEPLLWYRQRAGSITYRTDWTYADSILVHDLVREQLERSGHAGRHGDTHRSAEMANLANVHTHYVNMNPFLAPRVREEARKRVGLAHWNLALNGQALTRSQRDFVLAYCRPSAAPASCTQWIPSLRQRTVDALRLLRARIRR